MTGRFTDRIVMITGSGSGIGRVMAGRFAAEGAHIVVADLDRGNANAAAAEISAAGASAQSHGLDVTDGAAVRELTDRVAREHGGIDVLVNNAAVATDTPFEALTEAEWDRDVGVGLKGAFLCSQAALRHMAARGSGAIVNIGSVNGLAYLGCEAYSAAKAGLLSLTQSIAVRYGSHGVRANAVVAGTIRTPAWEKRVARNPDLLDRLTAWYPLGRVGAPDDVANAAMFLASQDAGWVTGAMLRVDGGLLAGNLAMTQQMLGEV